MKPIRIKPELEYGSSLTAKEQSALLSLAKACTDNTDKTFTIAGSLRTPNRNNLISFNMLRNLAAKKLVDVCTVTVRPWEGYKAQTAGVSTVIRISSAGEQWLQSAT